MEGNEFTEDEEQWEKSLSELLTNGDVGETHIASTEESTHLQPHIKKLSKHCRYRMNLFKDKQLLPPVIAFPILSRNPKALKMEDVWKVEFEKAGFIATEKAQHATFLLSKQNLESRLPHGEQQTK